MNHSQRPPHDGPIGSKRRIRDPEFGERKRARIAVSKTSALKAGKLQEIPMELVFEILSYVQPYDLLKLARINKAFRCLLISRSSAFLWRISRANADDVPNPPFEFSEPAYAHLLFINYCSVRSIFSAMFYTISFP
ncbi:uncharacterized protein C8R40DRAFT_822481 [Lentinula edodes]|uniref:uncharacterized protein n=1 Tax=Lentinula edodes TaxID=5353 RepID=UPI001E8EBB75|nr:uncharacterized protein C8R40DRAFT_822481 [Lentinula edodes]KAH7868520.1 hypothetical protein C8R40DRAFT_822481 [Lentinula edodes]